MKNNGPGLLTPEPRPEIIVLFVLLAASLLCGQSSSLPVQQTQPKLAQAAALARLHRFAEARRMLEGVSIPSDPKQAIAFHRLRASVEAGLQRPEQASLEMRAALRLSPNDPGLLRAAAVADLLWLDAQLKTRSPDQVAATLDDLRALSLPDGERAELRNEMGERLLMAGAFRDAILDLSESVRLAPSNTKAWTELAGAQLHDGDQKAALASALQARTLHDTGEVEGLLGDIYESGGDSVASARSYEEAVRLSPGEERFRLDLAVELMQHQTFEPAIAILDRSAIDFPESPRIRTALGLTLFLSGREREGTAKVLEAVSLDSTFIPAIRYLGEIARSEASPQAGVVKVECDYADAHQSDIESNAVCGGLKARVAAENSATADWEPILRRLAAAAAGSPISPLAHCEYGKVLDLTRDWSRARLELETCARLDPNSVEAHYRLARIYRRLGLKKLAGREFALHSAAERRVTAANDAREQSVKGFLYTIRQR